MKTAIFLLVLLLSPQIPKNDPNGIWEADTGTAYRFQLNGTDLKVQLVEGSNPKYLKYEVALKNSPDEVNTYKGSGFFLAKTSSGKECRFETEWQILIVSPDQLYGKGTSITFDSNTCEVKEKGELILNFKKRK